MTAPEKIGRYEIKSELGRGGFATVYRAYDPLFEREVAIKFLPPELIHADPQFRMRFEREAKIIAQLEHPSIVPVYDVGEENHQPYFVMRYMSGGSLSERIKQRTFSVEEAVKVLDQIAPGMDEAHLKGIIHRDLKPANILFTNRDIAMISDFGIAKFSQGEAGSMTGSAIIGTPAYMAPEQASGESIDGRADIYALGVILYEMVTGKQPYHADTPLGLAIKHITEPVPLILEANPQLPSWMEMVISTAMAKNRDDRFSTAVEMVETIKAFLRGEAPPEKKSNATVKVSPFNKTAAVKTTAVNKPTLAQHPQTDQKRRSPVLAIVGGLIVVAAVIGGGFYFLSGNLLQSGNEATVTVSAPTQRQSPAETVAPVVIQVTATSIPATDTPTVEPSVTPTLGAKLPIIGGADKIAFLRSNDIWVMNADGSEPKKFTNDGIPKSNLQWLNDGDTILYMTEKTVKSVNIVTEVEDVVYNALYAEYLEGFSVSPDNKSVAISVNRELFIVPFDLIKLRFAVKRSDLLGMEGCLYNEVAIKDVQWSDDGTQLAIEYISNVNGVFADAIRVVNVQNCDTIPTSKVDDFPPGRFQFPNEIVNFNWDGNLLFLLNTRVRNEGFGDLYLYSIFTHKAEKYAPFEGNCCYRDAAFSPDGTYVIFAFQDIRKGTDSQINLYYEPADSLSTARTLEPILPKDFFSRRIDAPQPALRPAHP